MNKIKRSFEWLSWTLVIILVLTVSSFEKLFKKNNKYSRK